MSAVSQKAPLPKNIGGYKIESLLSQGRMSVLYLAVDPNTHEPLVVKVLSPQYANNGEMVERFLHEAELIQITDHPNIIKLLGHGKWESGVYIAMEFIQGISLRQMILQGATSLRQALGIVLQISHALTHLHTLGIIHRDLKPENILMTAQGGVKVIDFGISQMHTERADSSSMMGTPVYMSPEQRNNPSQVSFATDIYSLGIIMYELILGRLCHGNVHLSEMPRGVQKILAKALQPKPEERYEDIVDFVAAIRSYLKSDEMQKERRGSDYLAELSEDLKSSQALLIPEALPNWQRFDTALTSNCKTALSSVYYDFFQSRDNVYHIVLGESLTTGVKGLLQISILKGMVRALATYIRDPVQFVQALNARIRETNDSIFSFSLLTLSPVLETFSYISCGYTPLWYVTGGSDIPRRLSADNAPLGSEANADILEVEGNLNMGDKLILHTFQAGSAKNVHEVETDEAHFLKALSQDIFLAPPKLVESVFRKVTQTQDSSYFERPMTLIGLERLA